MDECLTHLISPKEPANTCRRAAAIPQHRKGNVKVDLGSIYGSIFVFDKIHCCLSFEMVGMICGWGLVVK